MSDKADLVSVVYDAINEIGKHKIRSDVISNIKMADEYMKSIFNSSTEHFINRLDGNSLITIYEILLHFMLTACTIPSQRKVKISQLTIDLVIPNLQILSRSPDDAILVQFIRYDKDMTTIDELLSLLKFKTEDLNMWLITTSDLHVKDTTQVINLSGSRIDCSCIIRDIDTFLKERRDKSFRLVHF
ncbi:MAG: hypothetical protein ACRD8Z_24920 [Nitrososphaeraceae archaeon]